MKQVNKEDNIMMVSDVAKAFFEAPVKRDVCVELPAEDMNEEDIKNDAVGKLQMSLHGTRDAAADDSAV